MPWPHMRFSVRQMMVAIAVVAVLIPFPIHSTFLFVITLVGLWFPLLGIWALFDQVAKPIGSNLLGFAIICFLTFLLWASRNALGLPLFTFVGWFGILSLVNLAGPFVLAAKLFRREPLDAGAILWGWTGLVWLVSMLGMESSGAMELLNLLTDCARLSLVVTLLLAMYGKRPSTKNDRWTYYAGWVVMECDIIMWGIFVA